MKRIEHMIYCLVIALFLFYSCTGTDSKTDLPDGFVDVKKVIPSVQLDLRYFTANNFIGKPIDGYLQPRCLLTRAAAESLARVQEELVKFSLSLQIFDAYRPQTAVNHFVRWAKDTSDTLMKKYYYPTIAKKHLFRDGYIADKSSHSRGSTVDLTIVPLSPSEDKDNTPAEQRYGGKQKISLTKQTSIDMGSQFDWFNPISHTVNTQLKVQQRANRLLLKTLMEKHGFRNYSKEWWHYTLNGESFPETYFDFPIK